jgi:hypothetical protein
MVVAYYRNPLGEARYQRQLRDEPSNELGDNQNRY